MATKYPSHESYQLWSDPLWSLADDDAQDTAKPEAGDDAVLTALSAAVGLDGPEACDSLDMSLMGE